jgi:hemolysin III
MGAVAEPAHAHLAARVDPTERFSFLSHAIGAAAAVAGLAFLVLKADGALAVAASALYGASLVVLLTASSLHHAIHPASPAGHRALHLLDHLSIFLLIAGTYTPVSLLGFTPGWGWSIFGVIWGLAVAGTLVRILWWNAPRWLYTGFYVAMGWTAVVAIAPLLDAFPPPALLLMLAGGLAYTVGAVVYARKRPDPWPRWLGFHGLWHVFVLLGAGLHYAFVYAYVV